MGHSPHPGQVRAVPGVSSSLGSGQQEDRRVWGSCGGGRRTFCRLGRFSPPHTGNWASSWFRQMPAEIWGQNTSTWTRCTHCPGSPSVSRTQSKMLWSKTGDVATDGAGAWELSAAGWHWPESPTGHQRLGSPRALGSSSQTCHLSRCKTRRGSKRDPVLLPLHHGGGSAQGTPSLLWQHCEGGADQS